MMDHKLSSVVSLACDLIACPSITPVDGGCQQIIAKKLAAIGFQIESMRHGEVDNLWARYGKDEPLLVFAGHTDVVPTGPLNEWSSPPFEPDIRHGYLYGRGAADMKSAVAAMVIAAEKFIKSSPDFSGSIAFLLTSDEEGSAVNGTRKVIEALQHRGIMIDYCIVGEPSSDKQVGDQIRIGRRGSLHGTLTSHGKQGHVAHPHLAKNPIHMSLQALAPKDKNSFLDAGRKSDDVNKEEALSELKKGIDQLDKLVSMNKSPSATKSGSKDALKQYQMEINNEPWKTVMVRLISNLYATCISSNSKNLRFYIETQLPEFLNAGLVIAKLQQIRPVRNDEEVNIKNEIENHLQSFNRPYK